MNEAPWLSEDEQLLWRRWLRVNALLPAALHRELQADSGLSLPDFDVLVHLTESDGGRMRISDLARALQWERSRLSHHVARMERRGLVGREECAEDARGAFAVLTPEGRAAIERAAPGHVRAVRRYLFDHLTDGDAEVMTGALARILAGLEAAPTARTGPVGASTSPRRRGSGAARTVLDDSA